MLASFRIFRLLAEFQRRPALDGASFWLSWGSMLPRPPLVPMRGRLIVQEKKAVTKVAAKLFFFVRCPELRALAVTAGPAIARGFFSLARNGVRYENMKKQTSGPLIGRTRSFDHALQGLV